MGGSSRGIPPVRIADCRPDYGLPPDCENQRLARIEDSILIAGWQCIPSGHKPVKFGRFKGVSVPATDTDPEVPWDIETAYMDEIGVHEELNRAETGDEEEFSDEMEDQFDDMAQDEDDRLASAVSGQSYESMMRQIVFTLFLIIVFL